MRKLLILFCALCTLHFALTHEARAVSCGDTLTQSETLTGNLTCATGPALTIQTDGITLDCAGFTIARTTQWTISDGESEWGVYLNGSGSDQVQGVTVKNCIISKFKTCLRMKEASGNTIRDTTLSDCGDPTADRFYGAEVTQNSQNNTFDTVTISSPGDEGLHGSGSSGLTVTGSTFAEAANENLYLLSCDGGTYTGNTFGPAGSTPGSNSAYVKDSSNNVFTNNTFRNKVLTLIGASNANSITGGSATAGIRLEQYEQVAGDQSSYRFPENNSFTNVAISATSDCLRVENAVGTSFTGGSLATCATRINAASVDSAGVPYKPTDLTFVSLDPYTGPVTIDGGVKINVGFLLDVHVQKTGPVALANALVQLFDARGTLVFTEETDGEGDIVQQSVTVRSGRMPVHLTPHRLRVTLPGYRSNSQDIPLTGNTTTTVTLTAQ